MVNILFFFLDNWRRKDKLERMIENNYNNDNDYNDSNNSNNKIIITIKCFCALATKRTLFGLHVISISFIYDSSTKN